jgi:hypothetical protein
LENSRPVVISVEENHPRIVITDGYHITKPLKLVYRDNNACCFRVSCAISDAQLLWGFALLVVCYLGGLYTGLLILKVVSFLPLLCVLMFYYLNRSDFLKLVPVQD